MTQRRTWLKPVVALALAGAGCANDPAADDDLDIPGFEDYVGGKNDTGYVGNQAAELEATFTGRVRVMLPGQSASELEATAARLRGNPTSWELRSITDQVTEQVKYARNVLKSEKLDLNLEGGSPTFSSVTVIAGGLELAYTLEVESLVKFKELEAMGLRPQDLVGREVMARLPVVPDGLFERTGTNCAFDREANRVPDAADLGAHNLFYYWDPSRPSCNLTDSDLVTASYRISSSLDAPNVYPEYDQLVADGRVDMAIIFGQIEHGELKANDWGFLSFNTMTRSFERLGFRRTSTFPGNRGHRLEKTYAGGLKVKIDMYTPVDFADSVPRETSNVTFRDAMRGSEIFYYNGHAFYGSLDVLDDPTAYPEDRYQILFMDACWSYAYYTKQIFRNRSTASDETGWALADVVNNTEPGITGSEATAAILYDNLFKGAAAVRTGADPSLYSWNNMIKYMNDHAIERARRRGPNNHPNPEIYGVSGVRTNRYNPAGTPPPPPPPTGGTHFENRTAVGIPDDDATGATSSLTVTGAGTVNQVRITANVTHTYIGDLHVRVEHAGKTFVLHANSGGSRDDLRLSVTTQDFAGTDANGEWKLVVVDNAGADVGTIDLFAIDLL